MDHKVMAWLNQKASDGDLVKGQQALTNAPISEQWQRSRCGAMNSTKYAMVGLDSNSEGCSTTEVGDKNELDYGQGDVAFLYGT